MIPSYFLPRQKKYAKLPYAIQKSLVKKYFLYYFASLNGFTAHQKTL